MLPTLKSDEYVLVDSRADVEVGMMVVAVPPGSEEFVIKRVGTSRPSGVWLVSDNPAAAVDSRRYGLVERESVRGVVTLVLNRPFMARSLFR